MDPSAKRSIRPDKSSPSNFNQSISNDKVYPIKTEPNNNDTIAYNDRTKRLVATKSNNSVTSYSPSNSIVSQQNQNSSSIIRYSSTLDQDLLSKNDLKKTKNEGKYDEDSDGSDDDADDGDDQPYEWMSNPFSVIDESADLEEVLAAKTIGEAMQILCPNIPGLPTKSRGKYKKRKLLSNEEKSEVLRATNRENARLTRKRKKIYHDVISNLLLRLHQDLGDDTVRKCVNVINEGQSKAFLAKDKPFSLSNINLNHIQSHQTPSITTSTTTTGFTPKSASIEDSFVLAPSRLVYPNNSSLKDEFGRSTTQASESNSVISNRVDNIRKYLENRISSCNSLNDHKSSSLLPAVGWTATMPTLDDWFSVCAPNITHIAPLPIYRDMSEQAKITPSGYECHGVSCLIDDSNCLKKFCLWVLNHRYPQINSLLWKLAIEIDPESVSMNANKDNDKLCLEYHLCLYVAISNPTSSSESMLSPRMMTMSPTSPTTRSKAAQQQQASFITVITGYGILSSTFPSTISLIPLPASSNQVSNANQSIPLSPFKAATPDKPISQAKSKKSLSVDTNQGGMSQALHLVKVMDISMMFTCSFTSDGLINMATEHYDVMQVLFDKEKLKSTSSIPIQGATTMSSEKSNAFHVSSKV